MDGDRIMDSPLFQELLAEVRQALAERGANRFNARPGLAHERTQLEAKMHGWTLSLGNPQLPPGLRSNLEANYAEADARRQEIEGQLAEEEQYNNFTGSIVDTGEVLALLERLDEVLSQHNPSRG